MKHMYEFKITTELLESLAQRSSGIAMLPLDSMIAVILQLYDGHTLQAFTRHILQKYNNTTLDLLKETDMLTALRLQPPYYFYKLHEALEEFIFHELDRWFRRTIKSEWEWWNSTCYSPYN